MCYNIINTTIRQALECCRAGNGICLGLSENEALIHIPYKPRFLIYFLNVFQGPVYILTCCPIVNHVKQNYLLSLLLVLSLKMTESHILALPQLLDTLYLAEFLERNVLTEPLAWILVSDNLVKLWRFLTCPLVTVIKNPIYSYDLILWQRTTCSQIILS